MVTQPQIPEAYKWQMQVPGPDGQPQQKEYSISKGTLSTVVYQTLMFGKSVVKGLKAKANYLGSLIQSLPDTAESLYQRAFYEGERGKLAEDEKVIGTHSKLAIGMLAKAPVNMALDVLNRTYNLGLQGYEKLTGTLDDSKNMLIALLEGLPEFGEAASLQQNATQRIHRTLEDMLRPAPAT